MQCSTSHSGSCQIRCPGNPIRHNGIGTAMQLRNAIHNNGALSISGNMGTATAQKGCKIADFRLSRCIMNDRSAVCPYRCQQNIFRSANGREFQMQNGTMQSVRRCTCQLSACVGNHCSHTSQCIQMHVNGPWPQFTAARIGNLTAAASSQQRTEKNNR